MNDTGRDITNDTSSTDTSDGRGSPTSPLAALEALAASDVEICPGLAHLEIYTMRGLLTVLWHGPRDAEDVVVLGGGAMGGLLGPGDGIYQFLGSTLADRGIGTLRLSYRSPNDLELCTHDMVAVSDLAARQGARRFVTMGHSFGGAIAIRAAIMLGDHCQGVVTFATQSAGAEMADQLGDVPLLMFHGDRDELLPLQASKIIHQLAGGDGELVVLPGTGHLMTEADETLRERLTEWVPARFEAGADGNDGTETGSDGETT